MNPLSVTNLKGLMTSFGETARSIIRNREVIKRQAQLKDAEQEYGLQASAMKTAFSKFDAFAQALN